MKIAGKMHNSVGKRTFTAAFWMRRENGVVADLRIAYGGVGPVIYRLRKTEAALIGKPFSEAEIEAATDIARSEITPISDVRGAAEYRFLLAENILRKFYFHVIGIGTVWTHKTLLSGANGNNPKFTGTNAKKEYGILKGTGPTAVPVENIGGPGTKNSHWRESLFKNELMSGFIAAPNNPLSRMTAASLKDLGYVVNMSAAEAYALPNLQALAEAGLMMAHIGAERAHALPILAPKVLPDESLAVGSNA